MTATIFGSVLGPSASAFSAHPTASHSSKLLSERNSAYYHHGSKHHKGKSKSDKKHAILSALTLLAFLFFISTLQNCIREQNANRGSVMMFAPTGGTAPTGHQAKDPGQDTVAPDSSQRSSERSSEPVPGNFVRRSRTLLGLGIEEPTEEGGKRMIKFIRNFSSVNNWTKELSQMSDRDLEDQKLKTSNFPLYWKNSRLRPTLPLRVMAKNETVSPLLRRFRKREKTSSSTESMPTEFKAPSSTQITWDYKRPDNFHPSPYIPDPNQTQPWQTRLEVTSTPHLTLSTPTLANPNPSRPSTTPRNRRSDYDDYDTYNDPTREDSHLSPTPAVGLDLNTFQTFPVYNYYNHRPRDNQTYESPVPASAPTPDPPATEIDRIHNDVFRLTTPHPLFHPTNTSPAHPKPFQHRHKNRYPPHHPHYHLRHHPPTETRHRFSPYRKTGLYEAPHFHDHVHDDYYPPLVLAKYEVQHEEPGFDLIKFLWAMVTSFARPLTKLVPSFAKESQEEAQCYDLLVCEAQRASRFMGPTAEALATTLGTLLTWAATEETRQTVLDAINSGRENTCQQQIKDCEDRSGGKSAMTVIAQVMEMKLR